MDDCHVSDFKSFVSSRWVVALLGGGWVGFTQVSFVNTIATTNGSKHVDHVIEQLVAKLMDLLKKKGKSATALKLHQVKEHQTVFINGLGLIINPAIEPGDRLFESKDLRRVLRVIQKNPGIWESVDTESINSSDMVDLQGSLVSKQPLDFHPLAHIGHSGHAAIALLASRRITHLSLRTCLRSHFVFGLLSFTLSMAGTNPLYRDAYLPRGPKTSSRLRTYRRSHFTHRLRLAITLALRLRAATNRPHSLVAQRAADTPPVDNFTG
ncbi:hypothetical protein T492DRAFT_900598 [Pavlovales sp. CCMP2436]|nr:hypothetical protein T492DRAFT_900598 [Pavlovales sp. CCMP2436]